MNSVITVNLGGNAYQLDEAGHAKLRAYLDAAALSLADNPDKTEILADIEAAIGDKCRLSLNPHKTVVTEADIDDILSEMGPVASGQDDNTHADTHAEKEKAPPSPKRLYRISEGSMWAGVCTGLAAYFDIDVTIIRLIFVILTFVTSGGFILAYFVMAVVVPKAATPEEYRAASRAEPVTAQALIDRAQEGYTNFKNSKEWRQWKHTMRHQAKQWGQQWNHQRRHAGYQGPATPYHRGWADELVQSLLALMWLLVISFGLWFGYHHIPLVHDFLDALPRYAQMCIDWVRAEIGR